MNTYESSDASPKETKQSKFSSFIKCCKNDTPNYIDSNGLLKEKISGSWDVSTVKDNEPIDMFLYPYYLPLIPFSPNCITASDEWHIMTTMTYKVDI